MNRPSSVQTKITSFIKRDQVLEELKNLTDELSDDDLEEDADSTVLDADLAEYPDYGTNLS